MIIIWNLIQPTAILEDQENQLRQSLKDYGYLLLLVVLVLGSTEAPSPVSSNNKQAQDNIRSNQKDESKKKNQPKKRPSIGCFIDSCFNSSLQFGIHSEKLF